MKAKKRKQKKSIDQPTESLVDIAGKVLVKNKPDATPSRQDEAETEEHLRGGAQCTMYSV